MQERILKMNFESTFKKYYRPLCLYAMHYLKGDIDDAEDVVQDCFVKLWQKHSDNTSCNIPSKSYLYISVRNACIDLLRKQNPCVSVYDPTDLDGYITDEEAQERSVQEAYLWSLIDELPVRCREVFLLSKRDGLRHSEIADELGISVKTVENQISKAMKKLNAEKKNIMLPLFVISIV